MNISATDCFKSGSIHKAHASTSGLPSKAQMAGTLLSVGLERHETNIQNQDRRTDLLFWQQRSRNYIKANCDTSLHFKAVHITAELTRFCSFTSMQPLESTHCACIGERDISANKHCWPSAAHHSYQACGIALHSNTGNTSGSVQMCTPAEIKHRRLCKGHLAWGLALAWLLQELGLVYVPAGASTMLCTAWTCCPFCNVCFGHDSLQ